MRERLSWGQDAGEIIKGEGCQTLPSIHSTCMLHARHMSVRASGLAAYKRLPQESVAMQIRCNAM